MKKYLPLWIVAAVVGLLLLRNKGAAKTASASPFGSNSRPGVIGAVGAPAPKPASSGGVSGIGSLIAGLFGGSRSSGSRSGGGGTGLPNFNISLSDLFGGGSGNNRTSSGNTVYNPETGGYSDSWDSAPVGSWPDIFDSSSFDSSGSWGVDTSFNDFSPDFSGDVYDPTTESGYADWGAGTGVDFSPEPVDTGGDFNWFDGGSDAPYFPDYTDFGGGDYYGYGYSDFGGDSYDFGEW